MPRKKLETLSEKQTKRAKRLAQEVECQFKTMGTIPSTTHTKIYQSSFKPWGHRKEKIRWVLSLKE
jgi:hypothetical protein